MSTLSTSATHEYYDELANALPSPVSDKVEHRERRLSTAIGASAFLFVHGCIDEPRSYVANFVRERFSVRACRRHRQWA